LRLRNLATEFAAARSILVGVGLALTLAGSFQHARVE
jgi:hypothetical protein